MERYIFDPEDIELDEEDADGDCDASDDTRETEETEDSEERDEPEEKV